MTVSQSAGVSTSDEHLHHLLTSCPWGKITICHGADCEASPRPLLTALLHLFFQPLISFFLVFFNGSYSSRACTVPLCIHHPLTCRPASTHILLHIFHILINFLPTFKDVHLRPSVMWSPCLALTCHWTRNRKWRKQKPLKKRKRVGQSRFCWWYWIQKPYSERWTLKPHQSLSSSLTHLSLTREAFSFPSNSMRNSEQLCLILTPNKAMWCDALFFLHHVQAQVRCAWFTVSLWPSPSTAAWRFTLQVQSRNRGSIWAPSWFLLAVKPLTVLPERPLLWQILHSYWSREAKWWTHRFWRRWVVHGSLVGCDLDMW